MCPLLPNVEPRVFWSTETTEIPKATLGKGKRTQVFQDFWRGLLLIILSNLKEMRKKIATCALRLHLNIFPYVKWMLHSLKLTARNSSNGNTLHYAERLASSTGGILMFNASNVCIFFTIFLCDYTRHLRITLWWKKKWSPQTCTQFVADT